MSDELVAITPEIVQFPAAKYDRRILYMFVHGRKWSDIAEITGLDTRTIKGIVKSPGFVADLERLNQDLQAHITEQVLEVGKTAMALKQKALGVLDMRLDSGMPQAEIASAKVILDEAARERGEASKGGGKDPISLDEVRAMGKEKAKQVIQDLQVRSQ